MLRLSVLAGFLLTAMLAPATAGAVCPPPLPYPGDAATKPAVAQWMAAGAAARGIPPELPVMAALVESGLTNAPDGAADAAGFFAMRQSIWNTGEYTGFPDQPELQLKWFIDQATLQRAQRISDGLGTAEADYGEWIADVERPAAEYRGRYQLRLAEARQLMGSLCAGAPSGTAESPVDTTPPAFTLGGGTRQRALRRRAVLVEAACGLEACAIAANGTVRTSRSRVFRISAPAVSLDAKEGTVLRFALGKRLRRAIRRALGNGFSVRARLVVTAVDASGNARTGRYSTRLRR